MTYVLDNVFQALKQKVAADLEIYFDALLEIV